MKVVLDTGMLKEAEVAHAYLKEVFQFPAYYGNNLDAFHDCITELAPLTIVADFTNVKGTYADRILRVLEDCAEDGIQVILPEENGINFDGALENIDII